MIDQQPANKNTVGNTTNVTFLTLGNKSLPGKVDTGATTCCLHAKNITVNQHQVSFVCPDLSNNTITVDVVGMQGVSSADGGEQSRPIIKLDIDLDGVQLKDVSFNLNDRSNMDTKVLIGQNALQAGNFVVDVSQGEEQPPTTESMELDSDVIDGPTPDEIMTAIGVIMRSNMTIAELVDLMNEKE